MDRYETSRKTLGLSRYPDVKVIVWGSLGHGRETVRSRSKLRSLQLFLVTSLLVACGGKLLVDTGNDGPVGTGGGGSGGGQSAVAVSGTRSDAGQPNGGTDPVANGGATSGGASSSVGGLEQGGNQPIGGQGGHAELGGAAARGGSDAGAAGQAGSDPLGAGGDTAESCKDYHQDGTETDADCGGKVCAPCAVDQSCKVDSDCQSFACDAFTAKCVFDPCIDHHIDETESDIDCGGLVGICARCKVGKTCRLNADCQAGHTCSIAEPHVCQ